MAPDERRGPDVGRGRPRDDADDDQGHDAGPGAGRPADDDSDPILVRRLRDEIAASGPITFARFMEVALYDPDHGYYTTASDRGSRSGDFLSAPELHPVFGRLVGRQIAECWDRLDRPDPFVVRDLGAGSGALAAGVLAGLAVDRPDLLDHLVYEPVEVSDQRTRAIDARLRSLRQPPRPTAASTAQARPERIVGVVLANELLDALPVHRIEWRDGVVLERYVDWRDDWFAEVSGPPSDPSLATRPGVADALMPSGAIGEVCLAMDRWVAATAASLARGYLLVWDYGHEAADLYSPRRAAGTLLAYRGHRVHDDPFRDVGRQDLTAHVDLTALGRAATANGLELAGRTSQAAFVAMLGLGDLLAERSQADIAELDAYLELRAAAVRLLDPRALGGFAVLAFGRDVPAATLTGFRDPRALGGVG
jgi:SAM-dependent MidA family methyltransferase